jgi:hypothetical protein
MVSPSQEELTFGCWRKAAAAALMTKSLNDTFEPVTALMLSRAEIAASMSMEIVR